MEPPRHVVVSGSIPLGDEATIASVKDFFRLRGRKFITRPKTAACVVEMGTHGTQVSTVRQHVRANPAELPSAKFLQTK